MLHTKEVGVSDSNAQLISNDGSGLGRRRSNLPDEVLAFAIRRFARPESGRTRIDEIV